MLRVMSLSDILYNRYCMVNRTESQRLPLDEAHEIARILSDTYDEIGWPEEKPGLSRTEQINLHMRFLFKGMERNADLDSVTELPNRAAFTDRLLVEARKAIRMPKETARTRKAKLVWIDLNGLKLLNDELSHAVGDFFLKLFGIAISSVARVGATDTVARLGGDEFGILLTGDSVSTIDNKTLAFRLVHGLESTLKENRSKLGELFPGFDFEKLTTLVNLGVGSIAAAIQDLPYEELAEVYQRWNPRTDSHQPLLESEQGLLKNDFFNVLTNHADRLSYRAKREAFETNQSQFVEVLGAGEEDWRLIGYGQENVDAVTRRQNIERNVSLGRRQPILTPDIPDSP